jgi:Uma2 family endonuclease
MTTTPEVDLDVFHPPEEGWTAADLDRLPNLPQHTELLDGGLFFMSPQKEFHRRCIDLLLRELGIQAPVGYRVTREMSVWLGRRDRPEPDVMVLWPGTEADDDTSWYPADAVLLAVEVVSPDSVERDQVLKPAKYARAGIPFYWRVDRDDDGVPVCYTYQLDKATQAYQPAGLFRSVVKAALPFPVEIDFADR